MPQNCYILPVICACGLFCCTDGLRLLPVFSTLRRSVAVSAKNAASLSNVDRSLLAATEAVSDFNQCTTAEGSLALLLFDPSNFYLSLLLGHIACTQFIPR